MFDTAFWVFVFVWLLFNTCTVYIIVIFLFLLNQKCVIEILKFIDFAIQKSKTKKWTAAKQTQNKKIRKIENKNQKQKRITKKQ